MGSSPDATPDVVVRDADRPGDLDAAGALTVAAYAEFERHFDPDDWAAYASTLDDMSTRADQGTVLVASQGESTLVGTATLYLTPKPTSGHWRPDDAVMRFLAVSPQHRHQGVGGALVTECLRRAAAAGRRRLALQTESHMTSARQLYRDMGFYRDEEGDQDVAGFDLVALAMDLKGV